jgi:2'-5' RNA ligase
VVDDTRPSGTKARLFLGVPVAVKTVESLGEVADAMRRDAYAAGYQIRWVPPINYHVTLAFLGDTAVDVIDAISDRLGPRIAGMSPFEFWVRGFGAFPSLEHARVLWAGVHDPAAGLSELALACADELEELGFPREQRAYHPHVTVGRAKRPDNLHDIVANHSERSFSRTRADFVVLFETSMISGSPNYVQRAVYGLGKADSQPKRQTKPLQPSAKGASEGASGEPDPAQPEATTAPVDQ